MTNETELVELRLAHEQEMHRLAAQGILWALVDATDEPAVVEKVAELGETRAQCLYRGEAKAQKAAVAPYLFRVDEETLAWINEALAGKPWGIFVASQADAATLARHFRSMLMVKGPKGEDLYFRFYDPRVVEMYLTQCAEPDVRRFYGPVRGYGSSGPNPGDVTFRVTRAAAGQQDSIAPIHIRQEQMNRFDAQVDHNIDERTLEKLKSHQGNLSDDEYRRRVKQHLARGRKLGMVWESSLAEYAGKRLRKGQS